MSLYASRWPSHNIHDSSMARATSKSTAAPPSFLFAMNVVCATNGYHTNTSQSHIWFRLTYIICNICNRGYGWCDEDTTRGKCLNNSNIWCVMEQYRILGGWEAASDHQTGGVAGFVEREPKVSSMVGKQTASSFRGVTHTHTSNTRTSLR